MRLSTGYVRASGYAHKLRRVLFALTRGRVDSKEVVRAAGELNQHIFEKLINMGVDKADVVRITIPFTVEDGKIVWDYDKLNIEIYRREEEERLAKALEEVEEREKELEERIKEIEEVAQKLRKFSEELLEKIERLKEEHTSLKLKAEE